MWEHGLVASRSAAKKTPNLWPLKSRRDFSNRKVPVPSSRASSLSPRDHHLPAFLGQFSAYVQKSPLPSPPPSAFFFSFLSFIPPLSLHLVSSLSSPPSPFSPSFSLPSPSSSAFFILALCLLLLNFFLFLLPSSPPSHFLSFSTVAPLFSSHFSWKG